MLKKIIGTTLLVLLSALFIVLILSIAKHTFQVGTGLAYLQQLELEGYSVNSPIPADDQAAIWTAATRVGLTYAVLGLAGFHIPIFCLLFLLVSHIFGFTARLSRRSLVGIVAALFIVGTVSGTLSQLQIGKSYTEAIQGAVGVWVLVALLLGLLFGAVRFIKRNFGRSNSAPINEEPPTDANQ